MHGRAATLNKSVKARQDWLPGLRVTPESPRTMNARVPRSPSRDAEFHRYALIIARAYALGYLTTTTPRLLSFVRILLKQEVSNRDKARLLGRILSRALRWSSFPTFCALLVGSSATVETILRTALKGRNLDPSRARLLRQATRFLAILISSWYWFPLLNSKTPPKSELSEIRVHSHDVAARSRSSSNAEELQRRRPRSIFAGRTLDLTLFAATRAADVLACALWKRWKQRRMSHGNWTFLESVAPQLADAGVFATSAAVVMWAWIYLPERLPFSYGRWIGEAAQVDPRLIEALRMARRGQWTYGQPKGDLEVLESMCREYGMPEVWGDTSKTWPIPCEIVHMGCGPNCEKHALWRFTKAFAFACSTYLPIQVMLKLRSRNPQAFANAAKGAVRSSTFLGLFVALFYYSVCLARTRLGPKIFSSKTITPMMWDSGLCIGAGCMACGWSILVENAKKRGEIALFVAPRAAATLLPRWYDRKYLYREQAAFALSTAIVLTAIQENPKVVRGVIGKVLSQVYA